MFFKNKSVKIPASSKKEVREGLMGFLQDGVEDVIQSVTMQNLIEKNTLERIGHWMKEYKVSHLKIGDFEVSRKVEEGE